MDRVIINRTTFSVIEWDNLIKETLFWDLIGNKNLMITHNIILYNNKTQIQKILEKIMVAITQAAVKMEEIISIFLILVWFTLRSIENNKEIKIITSIYSFSILSII